MEQWRGLKKDRNAYETHPRESSLNGNKTERLKKEEGNFEYHKRRDNKRGEEDSFYSNFPCFMTDLFEDSKFL